MIVYIHIYIYYSPPSIRIYAFIYTDLWGHAPFGSVNTILCDRLYYLFEGCPSTELGVYPSITIHRLKEGHSMNIEQDKIDALDAEIDRACDVLADEAEAEMDMLRDILPSEPYEFSNGGELPF